LLFGYDHNHNFVGSLVIGRKMPYKCN